MPQFNKVSFGDVLSDAYRLLKGSKTALLLAVIALIIASFIAFFLTNIIAPGWLSPNPGALDTLVANLLSVALSSPLLGGLALMSLERARGREIQGGMIFSGTRFATRFLVYGLFTTALSMLLSTLPFAFNQLIWLAISALFSFTAFFIVDREENVMQAIISSIDLVATNLAVVLGWLLLGVGLSLVGVLTLGIGLIWIVPFVILMSAMIYRHATDGTASDTSAELA